MEEWRFGLKKNDISEKEKVGRPRMQKIGEKVQLSCGVLAQARSSNVLKNRSLSRSSEIFKQECVRLIGLILCFMNQPISVT